MFIPTKLYQRDQRRRKQQKGQGRTGLKAARLKWQYSWGGSQNLIIHSIQQISLISSFLKACILGYRKQKKTYFCQNINVVLQHFSSFLFIFIVKMTWFRLKASQIGPLTVLDEFMYSKCLLSLCQSLAPRSCKQSSLVQRIEAAAWNPRHAVFV